MMNHVILH